MIYLQELIEKQVAASLVNRISATTDKVAEEMAKDILKDKEFKEEMQSLIREAFKKALSNLMDEKKKVL